MKTNEGDWTMFVAFTEDEIDELQEAASGEDVAAWVRRVALERARRPTEVQYRPERETRGRS